MSAQLTRPLAEQLADDFGDWQPLLQAWAAGPAGRATIAAVDARVASGAVVYPPEPFRALALTPRTRLRVLILGQDPYHGPGQAEGLAFSVPSGVRVPPSLRNIRKEIARSVGGSALGSGSLVPWAQQGVLLLNTTLTVEDGRPASHARLGWQALTDAICIEAARFSAPVVFMLWGAHAQAKAPLLAAAGPQHPVLQANHPSPLSATRPPTPFIGCGHFAEANRLLGAAGRGAIDWVLP